MKKISILASMWFALWACQSKTTQDPLLEEAHQLHLEALALQQQVEPQLDSLIQADSVQYAPLRQSFQDWEASLVEVPGFEHAHDHDHDHAHDHSHSHAAQPEVTPEQMKAIQAESLENLKKLVAQMPAKPM